MDRRHHRDHPLGWVHGQAAERVTGVRALRAYPRFGFTLELGYR